MDDQSLFKEQPRVHAQALRGDAPADFIEKMIGAIVGIKIVITRLLGKWKVSQNLPVQNREGVIQGLRESKLFIAVEIASLIESWSPNNR